MTDAEFLNHLVDSAHRGEVIPQDDKADEAATLIAAIKESLHEEGLHKIVEKDKYHLLILDNPGFDYSLMTFAGRIILGVPTPRHKVDSDNGGTLKFFDLADPNCFKQVATAVRSYPL